MNAVAWASAHVVKTDSITYLVAKLSEDPQKLDDPDKAVNRYLIVTKKGDVVTGGYLYDILGKTDLITTNADDLITHYDKGMAQPFTGNLTKQSVLRVFNESKIYNNGVVTGQQIIVGRKHGSGLATQSTKKVNADEGCTDWFMVYYVDGVEVAEQYLYTTCNDGGPICPTITMNYVKNRVGTMSLKVSNDCGDGGGGSDGGGDDADVINITDDVKTDYPCAGALIIDRLLALAGYSQLVSPFNTTAKPDLTYTNAALNWNKSDMNGHSDTQFGDSKPSGSSSTITLNNSMLDNSSPLLIASVVINETLHAVINYNIVQAGNNIDAGESWMSGLNSWYFLSGLPINFATHEEMMDYYFNQMVTMLAQFNNDPNMVDIQHYRMLTLSDMNVPGNSATIAQRTMLQNEYTKLKNQFGITDSDINTYIDSQKESPTDKLPTTNDCK